MTVYIEQLIIDNFAFDCLIAYITLSFLRGKIKILNILLSAVIGTIFAVFFPYIPAFLLILYKLLALILGTIVLKKNKKIKDYLAVVFVYTVTSAALAGIAVLIFNMKANSIYGTFIYEKGGMIGILSLCAIIALYLTRQMIGLYLAKRRQNCIVDAEIMTQQECIKIKGLVDTGNRLTDDRGKGMIILSKDLSEKLEKNKKGADVLISTINGQNIFNTIIIDELKIYYKDKVNTIRYVAAALTKRRLEDCDAILFENYGEDI